MPRKKPTVPKNYQAAMEELQSIVAAVENQEMGVDELSEKVKYALDLVQFCKNRLRNTEEAMNQAFDE